jgi:hypothetical protein
VIHLDKLFAPAVLNFSEIWPDIWVFALGEYEGDSLRRLTETATVLAVEKANEHIDSWYDDEPRPLLLINSVQAYSGPVWNDRYMAEDEGYSYCVTSDRDLEPVTSDRDLEPDWVADEMNVSELWVTTDEEDERYGELADDWPERVRANPDRYPCAPLGPFPGVIVVVSLTVVEREAA